MAVRLINKTNIETPDGDFPYGNVKDNPGNNTGTPVNKETFADYIQFFHKLMDEASKKYPAFNYNNVPESAYDGFQFYEALLKARPYKIYTALLSQTGTSDPAVTLMTDSNTLDAGNAIVWVRLGLGLYEGTLSGAFTANKTWCSIGHTGSAGVAGGFANLYRTGNDTVQLFTYDVAGSPADQKLSETPIEIRVYP